MVEATRQSTSKSERIANAQAMAGMWLARGNEAAESGKRAKAEKCYEKSQHWLDRLNALEGRL